jgi:hypothetical protein
MKHFTLYLLGLLCYMGVQAAPEPEPVPAAKDAAAATKTMVKNGAVRFQFTDFVLSRRKDSVLVIFDRYDRTGAGIVFKVFKADLDNGVTVPEVPAGKYFVTVQCLGLHRDRMEKKVVVKYNKNHTVNLALGDSQEFSKDKVVIPAYRFDITHMTVLK